MKGSRKIFNTDVYTISKEFNALDYSPTENNVRTQIEKETHIISYYILSITQIWFAVILLGCFVGFLGAIQSIIIEELFILKNQYLAKSLQKSVFGSSIYWTFWIMFPTMMCAYLIVYIEPTLKGSGVASIIAYLNGVRIKGFHKFLSLWLLYLSLFLISAANMPGGREEVFISIGAICGACFNKLNIPFINWKPFLSLSDSNIRRTLVASGTAAGVAASFGTPIGAVLFCLEEGITHWSPDLTFLMFFCSICSNFALNCTYGLYSVKQDISFYSLNYLFFSGVDTIDLTYKFFEIPIFIFLAVVGTLLGSLWNEGQIYLYVLRKKFIKNKGHKILEVLIFGAILSITGIVAFHMFGDECIKESKNNNHTSGNIEMKVYCKEDNTFESISVFLFQDLRNAIKSLLLWHRVDVLAFPVLCFGILYYFIFSALQFGTHLPSGVLIPQLLCGACWGYWFGDWYSNGEKLTIAKYAFLGAIAQGSGAVRLTISLGMIMVESCGKNVFAIPIFIIVVIGKWLGGFINRPIYITEVYLNEYPYIWPTHLPLSIRITAKEFMSSPLVSITSKTTIGELIEVLTTGHNSYPVIEEKKVVGMMKRFQILYIFKIVTNELRELEYKNKSFREYDSKSFPDLEKDIDFDEYLPFSSIKVDLTNYMSLCPHFAHSEMPLRRIYLMFVSLGISYVIVVDETLNAVGIITRKDVAPFRKHSSFLLLQTEHISIR